MASGTGSRQQVFNPESLKMMPKAGGGWARPARGSRSVFFIVGGQVGPILSGETKTRLAHTVTFKPAAVAQQAPSSSTASWPSSIPAVSSSASSAADGIHVPALDLSRPQPDVTPIKEPKSSSDSAVFGLQSGSKHFMVKQLPFYTPEHAARVEAISHGQAGAPALVTEEQAMHEINMAREVAAASAAATSTSTSTADDVFVQPLSVFTRAYTRTFVSSTSSRQADRLQDLAPDREVIAVYPLHEGVDAAQHVSAESERLAAHLAAGKLFLDEVVEAVVALTTGLARNEFELLNRMHKLGFVLGDHKLENMVFNSVKARWQLIDAAEVQRCRAGERCPRPSRGTPFYEAPEQRAGLGSDSRTDVFACGRAIQMAVSDCLDRFGEALGGKRTREFRRVRKAIDAALVPLAAIITPCTNAGDPEARPTAAEALGMLRDLQSWAL